MEKSFLVLAPWDTSLPKLGKFRKKHQGQLWGVGPHIKLKKEILWIVIRTQRVWPFDRFVEFDNGEVIFHGRYKECANYLYKSLETPRPVNGISVKTDGNDILCVGHLAHGMSGDESVVVGGNKSSITGGNNSISVGGNGSHAISGAYGISVVGNNGIASTGYKGTAVAGKDGVSITGHGYAISNDFGNSSSYADGISVSGRHGISTSTLRGVSLSLESGQSKTVNQGLSITGIKGEASSGLGGCICIQYNDGKRLRMAVGYVGEDGILPEVMYQLNKNHQFIPTLESIQKHGLRKFCGILNHKDSPNPDVLFAFLDKIKHEKEHVEHILEQINKGSYAQLKNLILGYFAADGLGDLK